MRRSWGIDRVGVGETVAVAGWLVLVGARGRLGGVGDSGWLVTTILIGGMEGAGEVSEQENSIRAAKKTKKNWYLCNLERSE